MQFIFAPFKYLLDLGSYVMLPVIIFIIAIILGTKPGKAVRSALFMAIALKGINVMTSFLSANMGPAMQALSKNMGFHLNIIDVGWGTVASSIWSTPMGAVGIPLLLLFNLLLIWLKRTKTLMIDIWNYHHLVTAGVLTYVATGSIALGFAAMLLTALINWLVSDWFAPIVQKFFGLPGITLPTFSSVSSLFIAAPLNELLDRIPGVNKIKGDFKSVEKYLGLFGEPSIIAVIIGLLVGTFAKYSVKDTLNLAINLATVMIVLPKVVAILMEGLIPIQEASREFMQKHLKGREVYLGLDSAIAIGHPAVLTAALILTPLCLILAGILPGNRMLPFADITTIPFRIALVVALTNGNVFRTLVIGIAVLASVLLCGTVTSPLMTKIFLQVGNKLPEGATGVASFTGGSLVGTYAIIQFFSMTVTGILFAAVLWGLFLLVAKSQKRKALANLDAESESEIA
jgi:PTS system galactitol-specific IIC component